MPTLPMDSLPTNEMGVVYLFADYARRHGLKVRHIQSPYPDCIAVRRDSTGEHEIRIEFEFLSSAFNHDPKGADWLVCWKDDRCGPPLKLNIVELSRYYGYGFNVWTDIATRYSDPAIITRCIARSVPVKSRVRKGDVILFGHVWNREDEKIGRPYGSSFVYGVHRVITEPEKGKATLRRLCSCDPPLNLYDLLDHKMVKHNGEGRLLTSVWPELRRLLIERRPDWRRALEKLPT